MSEELTFQQKIIAIQSELKAPKNQYNKFGKFHYRSCEDILEGLKPLLKKYGLMQTITDSIKVVGERYYIESDVYVTDGANGVSVSGIARESLNKKGMDDSQITGTSSSYARKYALNGLWLIDDTKDADTDEHKAVTQKKPKPTLTPDSPRWEKAVHSFAKGETDMVGVRQLVNISKEDEKKLIAEAKHFANESA